MNTKQAAAAAKSGYSTKELVLDAMFIALTYVFTAFVNVRLPIAANGGLIHLGNVPLFICAILLGKRTGMLAGAFGMGLFDLLSGWTAWAPFTCVIKVVGYYIAEVILYHNLFAPVASIPGNLVQIGTAAVIVLICVEQLRKVLRPILK